VTRRARLTTTALLVAAYLLGVATGDRPRAMADDASRVVQALERIARALERGNR
jgi:hypothetical protein